LPIELRRRTRPPALPTLDLPPPFRLVTLRESRDAVAHARTIAADGGAGTLVHVGRFDLVEFAVVLEPDEPLATARRTLYAGLVALYRALAMQAPPLRTIDLVWPDAIEIDGALVGGARLAWPAGAAENKAPDWLVFGVTMRAIAGGAPQAGHGVRTTTLEEAGFDDPNSGRLVESWARQFMATLDGWRASGFGPLADSYLAHLAPEDGASPTLDANGDLLLRRRGHRQPDRLALAQALAEPTWLDPATGAPRA
jgi:hypothetical protein